jgi:PhnB protein
LGAADDFFAPAESKREQEATMAVKPVPEGHHTLVPHLALKDCAKAIEFYKAAFGARENSRLSMPDGKIIHADLTIGDSHVFLMDEPLGAPSTPPAGTIVHMWSPEPDAVFERASKAGAKVTMPLQDMFWGDRYGQLVDPFGHMWSVAKHLEDLSPEEIKKRAMKVYAEMKKGSPGR